MNVPELKLLSSSSSIDSVSSAEEEADEGKDGNEEGRNTGNSITSKTNSSSTDDTEEEQQQENLTMQQEKLTEHHVKNILTLQWVGKTYTHCLQWQLGAIVEISQITKNLQSISFRSDTRCEYS